MSTTNRKRPTIHTSPVLTLLWAHLVKPDTRPFQGKAVTPAYKVTGMFPVGGQEQAFFQNLFDQYLQPFEADKRKALSQNPRKASKLYRDVNWTYDGALTDSVGVKFKTNASFVYNGADIEVKVPLYHPNQQQFTEEELEDLVIGNGSTARIAFNVIPYCIDASGQIGCSLRLKAVQLIKVQRVNTLSGAGYGFGQESQDRITSATPKAAPVQPAEAPFSAEGVEPSIGGQSPSDTDF